MSDDSDSDSDSDAMRGRNPIHGPRSMLKRRSLWINYEEAERKKLSIECKFSGQHFQHLQRTSLPGLVYQISVESLQIWKDGLAQCFSTGSSFLAS